MIPLKQNKIVFRGVVLALLCVGLVVWNMALAVQRRNLTGTFFQIKREDVVLKVNCSGKIEPKVFETIRSEIDGRKLETLVNVGETVTKGQLLMTISDERIKLELAQKVTQVQNLRSDMVKAKKEYAVEKNLYQQQAVPLVNVENAKEKYDRAVQSFNLADQELEVTQKKANGVRVLASMDGVLIKSFIERDDWISAGKELFVIAKLEKFAVRCKVDELDIGQVKLEQEAIITCDAFQGIEMKGKVGVIGAQAGDGAFAEIEVMVDIVDTKGLNLKPNLSAEVGIISGMIQHAIMVPSASVHTMPSGSFVYVKKVGGWVISRPVQVRQVSSDTVLVEAGLDPGQSILVPKETAREPH